MRSLRSVITQATRGGRCVVSRPNFCYGKETKGAAERIGWEQVKNILPSCGYLTTGYLAYCAWECAETVMILRQAQGSAMAPSESEDD
ncbi:unnamed protein product [Microthlaspi erraticum]|uniref:Uncharacterized protein n=1 Tax=Microthlaspi erraticum TaxID=1685480 RepID=A0A6D2HSB5_9BRAS|nr:unnamed protein product [Microthlaspi erraticum]